MQIPLAGGEALRVCVDGPEHPWITLICVHGWTLDWQSFEPQAVLANAGIRVVRYDRRGYGSNQLSPSFDADLQDLMHLVAWAKSPCALFGVSQGGRLALRLAASGDAELAAVVVQGAVLDGFEANEAPGEAIPIEDYTRWLAAGDLDAFRCHWLNHPLVVAGMDATWLSRAPGLIAAYTGSDLLTPGALPTPMDIRATLAQHSPPVLAITGSLETSARQQHDAAVANLTGGQQVFVEGGGHLCNLSHAQVVNTHLHNWLAQSVGGQDGANEFMSAR